MNVFDEFHSIISTHSFSLGSIAFIISTHSYSMKHHFKGLMDIVKDEKNCSSPPKKTSGKNNFG